MPRGVTSRMSAARTRELLTASQRSRRPEEDLDEAAPPRRVGPGKVSIEDAADVAPSAWRAADPGRVSHADAGTDRMSPEQALRYAEWMIDRPRIDRRTDSGGDVDQGALASVFSFLDGARGGRPLPPALRARLEAELGAPLDDVR